MVGLILWLRYALFNILPWFSFNKIYARYFERPGTKAYSLAWAKQLFASLSELRILTPFDHGDKLPSNVG